MLWKFKVSIGSRKWKSLFWVWEVEGIARKVSPPVSLCSSKGDFKRQPHDPTGSTVLTSTDLNL